MDKKTILPNSLAAQGKSLPAKRGVNGAAGVPAMLRTEVRAPGLPPGQRVNWVGPRYEPANLSASATVSDVQTAIRAAEYGDPTLLFRFYRDALLGDDHIQGELSKRKLAVIGQPLMIAPLDGQNEEDVKAAAACTRAIADCENWSTGLGSLLSAVVWPVAVAENIFTPASGRPVRYDLASTQDDDAEGRALHDAEEEDEEAEAEGAKSKSMSFTFPLAYTLKRIEAVNPMLFCFRHAYQGAAAGMGTGTPMQAAGEGRREKGEGSGAYALDLNDWEPFLRLWPTDEQGRIIYDAGRASKLDPVRHLVHRGHLLTEQRDNWGGPFRSILMLWLMRGLGREWFGRFMERYGMPFPVGKTNVQDLQSVDLLKTAFSLATKIGGLVIGQDDAVELAAANVQGGAEGHKLWVTLCNDAISFALTGIKPSDSPGGLNAGQNQQVQTIREDLRVLDQKLLGEVLVKQLFRKFLDFNGLPGQVASVWGGLSEADALTFAQLVKTLGEAGFEPTDDAVPGIQEKVGFEVQRKAAVEAGVFGGPGGATKDSTKDSTKDVETLGVRRMGKLVYFSAGSELPRVTHPSDAIAERRAEALGKAYRGAMAPFRQIVLTSDSREECLKRLSAAYADWDPGRLASELEEALQVCAAAGAVAAVEHKG